MINQRDDDSATPLADEALENARFLRELAVQLNIRPQDVDDVLQQTWMAAAEERGPVRKPRAWLASVLRHRWLDLLRSDEARRHHERAAAEAVDPREGQPDEREDRLREALRGALRSLREPYQETLLLHYFEGLPTAEVARRMDVPEETARTRVRRGLALLREGLIERPEDRRRGLRSLFLLGWKRRNGPSIGRSASSHTGWVLACVVTGLAAIPLVRTLTSPSEDVATVVVTPERARHRGDPADATPIVDAPSATEEREVAGDVRPAQVIDVFVHEPDGRPAVGADVLMFQGWQPSHQIGGVDKALHQATTGPDGRARLDKIPRSYNLRAEKDGLVSRETYFCSRGGPDVVALEMHLVRPHQISGEVHDEDGHPIPDALITSISDPGATGTRRNGASFDRVGDLEIYRSSHTLRTARTDAQGRFELTGLAPGPYDLHVDADGYTERVAPLLANDDQTSVTLALESNVELSLFRTDGSLTTDATVDVIVGGARPAYFGNPVIAGRPTEEGRMRAHRLDSYEWAIARVECPGHAPALIGPFELTPGWLRLDVQLTSPRRLAVRVTDTEGRPIAGASVRPRVTGLESPLDVATTAIWQMFDRATYFAPRVTNEQGTASFDNLPDRALALEITHPRSASTVVATVGADEETTVVSFLATDPTGIELSGKVLDGATGRRLPRGSQARITAISTRGLDQFVVAAHADGTYRLPLPKDGDWRLLATAKGRSSELISIDAAAEEAEYDFTLYPTSIVTLRAEGSDQTPITNAYLFFEHLDGRPIQCEDARANLRAYAKTGTDGSVVVRGLPEAPIRVVMEPPGLGLRRSIEVDLRERPTTPFTLRFDWSSSGHQLAPIELREAFDSGSRPLQSGYTATVYDRQGETVAQWTGDVIDEGMVLDPAHASFYVSRTEHGHRRVWRNQLGRADAFNRPSIPIGDPIRMSVGIPAAPVRVVIEAQGFHPLEAWVDPADGTPGPLVLQPTRD